MALPSRLYSLCMKIRPLELGYHDDSDQYLVRQVLERVDLQERLRNIKRLFQIQFIRCLNPIISLIQRAVS